MTIMFCDCQKGCEIQQEVLKNYEMSVIVKITLKLVTMGIYLLNPKMNHNY